MVSRLRHTARSIVASAALGAVALASPLGAAGCFTNACDGDFRTFAGGQLVSSDTWQTSDLVGSWLPFPARRTYWLDTQALGRLPSEVNVWVSTVERPNEGTGSFTLASGNIALIGGVTPQGMLLTNDTCSELFVRVVVKAVPEPARDAGAADAGLPDLVDASAPGEGGR
jgi:hypothetical protein